MDPAATSPAIGSRLIISDPTGILSSEERERIEAELADVCRESPAQIIVHLVDAVPGRRFREHAVSARHEFSTDEKRSIILVISRCDRHAEIATAPQFSDRFTGEVSMRLLQLNLVPFMRQDRISEGIVTVVGMICALARSKSAPPQRLPRLALGLMGGIAVALLGVAGYFYAGSHLCRECSHWAHVTSRVITPASYSSGGTKGVEVNCGHCGAHYTEIRAIPSESSNSSGAGSGFGSSDSGDSGGGSDGGGGADW